MFSQVSVIRKNLKTLEDTNSTKKTILCYFGGKSISTNNWLFLDNKLININFGNKYP